VKAVSVQKAPEEAAPVKVRPTSIASIRAAEATTASKAASIAALRAPSLSGAAEHPTRAPEWWLAEKQRYELLLAEKQADIQQLQGQVVALQQQALQHEQQHQQQTHQMQQQHAAESQQLQAQHQQAQRQLEQTLAEQFVAGKYWQGQFEAGSVKSLSSYVICLLFPAHQDLRTRAAPWKQAYDRIIPTRKAFFGHLEDGGTL